MFNSLQLTTFRKHDEKITTAVNILVAIFFITILSFTKGYSYVPMTLGTIATVTFFFYHLKLKLKYQVDKEDKYLISALIAYILTFLISIIFNGDSIRVIDNPSKILLFIPLIFFLKLYPIKQYIILHAIPVGALVVGLLAIYQKFILKLPTPFPGTMHIQAGNISMLLGLFSITIAFYWLEKNKYKTGIVYIAFSAMGILASILTGARGGWIAFPVSFLLILFFNYKHLNKKTLSLIAVLLITFLSLFIYKPEFGIQSRYQEAKNDIMRYFNDGNESSSLGARFDMWENALIAISERPIIGHGRVGYEEFKYRQVASQKMEQSTLQFNSQHNQYLESFVKRGIIGFIGLMAILFIPLLIFAKRLKNYHIKTKCYTILGIIHIVSHMIFFLSQSFFNHNSGTIFYFFILILLYHLVKQEE